MHAFIAVKAGSANIFLAWPLSLTNVGIREHLVLLDWIAFCIVVSSQSLISLGLLFCREDSNVKVTNDVSILQLSGREIRRPRTLSWRPNISRILDCGWEYHMIEKRPRMAGSPASNVKETFRDACIRWRLTLTPWMGEYLMADSSATSQMHCESMIPFWLHRSGFDIVPISSLRLPSERIDWIWQAQFVSLFIGTDCIRKDCCIKDSVCNRYFQTSMTLGIIGLSWARYITTSRLCCLGRNR